MSAKPRNKKSIPPGDLPDVDLPLPKQHVLFLEAYMESGNATKAAIAAGYKPSSARTIGHYLLTNIDILAVLEAARREQAKKFEATRERCIQEIAKLAFEGRSESTRLNSLRALGEHLGIFEGKRNADPGFSAPDSAEVHKALRESED